MILLEADIDLARLRSNAVAVKNAVGVELCAVVKADAYGHGLVRVANALKEEADEFAVATIEEAVLLCESGIRKPINILGCTDCDILRKLPKNSVIMSNIVPTICDFREINEIKNKFSCVNIKLNTGMNRLGVAASGLDSLFSELGKNGIAVKGIFTHLYNGDSLIDSEKQLDIFIKATSEYSELGIKRHCCASNCMKLDRRFYFDMVRCGLALYGYGSEPTYPVMSVHTNILQVMNVKRGEHISYGDYVAPCDMKIAAIRAGYADGYRRIGDKERFVGINGKRCRVEGQVCMDITLVDVSDVPLCGRDRVYLLGGGIDGRELAESCNTIVYEILTSFKGRIKRNYIG